MDAYNKKNAEEYVYYYTPQKNIFRTNGTISELLYGEFPLTETWTAFECKVSDKVLSILGFVLKNDGYYHNGKLAIKRNIKSLYLECDGEAIELFSKLIPILEANNIPFEYNQQLLDSL